MAIGGRRVKLNAVNIASRRFVEYEKGIDMTRHGSANMIGQFFTAYVIAAIIFGAMDFVWLSNMADSLYRPVIGELMADEFHKAPAIAFYAIYLFGIVWFGIKPGLISGQWTDAALNGALFGAIAYATYDLTSQAVLKTWSTKISLFDITWGGFATGTTSALTAIIVLRFVKG